MSPLSVAVENELFPTLRARFPRATFALDRARTHAMAYYRGLCFHIYARGSDLTTRTTEYAQGFSDGETDCRIRRYDQT